MPKRIHIETFGCQMNDYESDRTYRLFHDEHGYDWVEDPSEADFVLLNTCSIREKADQKAFSLLGRLRACKQIRPEMVIAVGGCTAQSQGEEIRRRAPYVDIVFGTHQWAKLPQMVDKALKDRKRVVETEFFGWREYSFLPYRSSTLARPVSELVTVQNGCDKFCTFCLVPFTRSRQISRPHVEVVEEIRGLVGEGVAEVTLLGQNVNAYGRDRRGEIPFAELLHHAAGIEGLARLRFITSHPAEFNDGIADAMAEHPKVCNHLHLPLQSGSDRILELMNRNHTLDEYRRKVAYLRKRIPGLSLTTDVIVGFPSETEEDFEKTLAALDEFQFDDSFSFCFSPRPHTKAAKWRKDFISPDVAAKRLERFQSRQREILAQKNAAYVGRAEEVLVEGPAKSGQPGWLSGRTGTNRAVNFEGSGDWVGRLIRVRILEALAHSFRGEAVNGGEPGC